MATISQTTWRQVELGRGDTVRGLTLSAMAKALDWPAKALKLISEGVPLEEATSPASEDDAMETITRAAMAHGREVQAAAASGIDISDLDPEDQERVKGYIDALRERRFRP